MADKTTENKKRPNLGIVIICIIFFVSAVLLSPILISSIVGEIDAFYTDAFGGHQINLGYSSYPNDPPGSTFSWKNWSGEVITITEEDFKKYPPLKELFLNINYSINKSEALEKMTFISRAGMDSVPIGTGKMYDEIKSQYADNKVLYWNGEYYRLLMVNS
ncbi:MAG: hypothetical protein Q7J08_03630 [Methanocorpusculum sp.]|uniref:hypothetical protein n=1 Tax=Methanocorpusculum sp. TaxID=2058474 RepID=UPI00271A8BAD|nr:hypothetical protein [Methanocorpusculum sp.]MDO9522785.1 hypothetical protein [Methanocorpusculum sp.]